MPVEAPEAFWHTSAAAGFPPALSSFHVITHTGFSSEDTAVLQESQELLGQDVVKLWRPEARAPSPSMS